MSIQNAQQIELHQIHTTCSYKLELGDESPQV